LGGDQPLYGRQVTSSLFWTIGLACLAIAAYFLIGAVGLLTAPIAWGFQAIRLGLRFGWAKGLHLLLGKFAEVTGLFRFVRGHVRGRIQGAILYK
jgi:hypothetical protein